jgi:hypothetical protein
VEVAARDLSFYFVQYAEENLPTPTVETNGLLNREDEVASPIPI